MSRISDILDGISEQYPAPEHDWRFRAGRLAERIAELEWFVAQINQYVMPGESDTRDAALIAFRKQAERVSSLERELRLEAAWKAAAFAEAKLKEQFRDENAKLREALKVAMKSVESDATLSLCRQALESGIVYSSTPTVNHDAGLECRVAELEAEKEIWGNEFNAVIIMKEQLEKETERLRLWKERCRRYKKERNEASERNSQLIYERNADKYYQENMRLREALEIARDGLGYIRIALDNNDSATARAWTDTALKESRQISNVPASAASSAEASTETGRTGRPLSKPEPDEAGATLQPTGQGETPSVPASTTVQDLDFSGGCPCGSTTSKGCAQTGCPLYLHEQAAQDGDAK